MNLLSQVFSLPICGTLLLSAGVAAADTLILPASVMDRKTIANVTYRLDHQITGSGHASIHWTDSLGRVVDDRTLPVEWSGHLS